MKQSKNAFTMIELVFVIVVLGILAAVAIPKFSATRTDAQISKGRADIASIRSAIVSDRQSKLIKGITQYIEAGTGTYTVNGTTYNQLDKDGLFGGVLTYPIVDSTEAGHWHAVSHPDTNSSTYNYNVAEANVSFTYTRSNGKFDCTTVSDKYCAELTH